MIVQCLRKHEGVSVANYHGDCADTTANWQEWESGATANFRLKRPASR